MYNRSKDRPGDLFDGHELWLGGSAFELLNTLRGGIGVNTTSLQSDALRSRQQTCRHASGQAWPSKQALQLDRQQARMHLCPTAAARAAVAPFKLKG